MKSIIILYNTWEEYHSDYLKFKQQGFNVAVVVGMELGLTIRGHEISKLTLVSAEATRLKSVNKTLITEAHPPVKKKRTFEMFSSHGEKACDKLVDEITGGIISGTLKGKAEIIQKIKHGKEKIAKKHKEIFDTEPESHIVDYVNHALKNIGLEYEINRFEV